MDAPYELRIIIVADERPALLRLFERVVGRLAAAGLVERLRVLEIAVYGLDRGVDAIFLFVC